MKKEMGIEGVGPKIMAIVAVSVIAAYLLDKSFHEFFKITDSIDSLNWLIIILLIIGVFLWFSSVILLLINFPKGKLITSGPYRIFLHPLYNAFIFFILPAIALYLNSWIYFGCSIVFLIAHLVFTKSEEQFLANKFGKEFINYKEKVIFKI